MKRSLRTLASIRLRSGTGVFEQEGVVHRVEVARTPLGLIRVIEGDRDLVAVLWVRLSTAVRNAVVCLPAHYLSRVRKRSRGAGAVEGTSKTDPRVQPSVVGVRAGAVTLHSEAADEAHAAHGAVSERDEQGRKSERRPPRVVEDSLAFAVGKKKVRLTVRARIEELRAIAVATGLDAEEGHRFEPAPWAVWRASHHIAPVKTTQGLHLRFVLGDSNGVAILSTNKRPLAWHVMSWAEGSRNEALAQAFHLLRIHAVRRLHLEEVTQVSLQGERFAAACKESLQEELDVPIEVVPGPDYTGDLIAFGLALGAVDRDVEVFNLARALQKPPTMWQLVPWGEAAFMMSLFLSMYLVLHFTLASTRQSLHVAAQQIQGVAWASGVSQPKLKDEAAALKKEVEPLKQFLTRDFSVGQTLATFARTLPSKVWFNSVTAEDLLWEKNSNKTLGNRYVLFTAGVPSEREGLVPPEVNETVRRLDRDPELHKVLPHVKLADVNWHKEGGFGYTVFSVLAVSQEVTK